MPYVILDGVEHIDSTLILDFLTEHNHLDPTERLSPDQQGVSRAVCRMMDESTAKY